jgi:high mobility group protein B1
MSAKEKGEFEDKAKADKARYEREMKAYTPPHTHTKGRPKRSSRTPMHPRGLLRPSCSVLSTAPKSKACPLVMLRRN